MVTEARRDLRPLAAPMGRFTPGDGPELQGAAMPAGCARHGQGGTA